ncbi:acyl-CoA dehydrogenase family protein [Rhodococcus coprophilus]|uniref:Acyl-CoA dehydrogenase n=1 Tax=Rhodococcus coprophilus TaxID=38310 RepID=A0A2X4UTK9_9NOCA|nr:acyl-CoA dehydrogenase family protein [Rhodococcus coprophilus]MBM7459512.1 acyl-CoA dehydrogenase [Rhodococcus coprophilus]SQI36340.1 acyl-CoA dehydrogenase [Rhodococcus coprophilus]
MSEFTAELISATTSMIDRIGVDLQTPAPGMAETIWTQFGDAGFATLGVPETAGGSGATLADALAVVSVAAQRGALTPLVEHGILATWLSATAGHTLTSATATAAAGPACTVRLLDNAVVLDGTVTDVAYAPDADTVVLILPPEPGAEGSSVAAVPLTEPGVTVSSHTDLTGASTGDITFEGVPVTFFGSSPISLDEFTRRGALAYAAATAATATAVHHYTLRYASERTQFGRPLAKFQAVQQQLAQVAALTTMMEIAVDVAITAHERPGDTRVATAAAKLVTAASAHPVAATGHHIHGAIGTTSEHPLGRFTTSLWSWRDRYGSERFWAEDLASLILDDGVDVWDVIVGTRLPRTSTPTTNRNPA